MPREGRQGGGEAEGRMGRGGKGKGEGGETGGPGLVFIISRVGGRNELKFYHRRSAVSTRRTELFRPQESTM
jgi:hypothetical protein